MAEKIKLVQGDTKPQVQFTIKQNESPIDISSATVTLHFRAVGSTTTLFSRQMVITDGSAGLATVVWQSTDLNQDAGDYEGEIEVVFDDSTRQTIFDPIKFKIREDFA
jgi:type 1 fimbria pilin